jgi:hypothetical protein
MVRSMKPEISEIIDFYLNAVAEAIGELRRTYPVLDNLLDRRRLGIPREGTLPSGRTYLFRGFGCRFELNGISVDIDFGKNGETNGFDAWRLHQCWTSYGRATNLSWLDIKSELIDLCNAGEIVQQRSKYMRPSVS